MKLDLTVAAVPAYIGAMGAEYLWQRKHPVPVGSRAGDYQLADTLASLSMGLGSLMAPYVTKRVLAPVTPGVGRFAKVLATTVADVLAQRRREGGLPAAGTVPKPVREVQDELADLRFAPATPRAVFPGAAARHRRSARVRGALAVSAVASTAGDCLTSLTIGLPPIETGRMRACSPRRSRTSSRS